MIDGRNRLAACEKAGVTPRFDTFDGDEHAILGLVLSKNLHRRHLNESQRAMVASKIARNRQGVNQYLVDRQICHSTIPEAAQRLNVSEKSVRNARAVRERGTPELVASVERGEVAVSRAAALAKAGKGSGTTSKPERHRAAPGRPARPVKPAPRPELSQFVLWVRTGATLLRSLGDAPAIRQALAEAGPGYAVPPDQIAAIRNSLNSW